MVFFPSKSQFIEKYRWLLLSLLCNLIIHLFLGLIYYNPVDFVLQYEAAKKIAQGQLLYRDIGKFIIGDVELPKPQYPPLYLYTLGFIIAIFGVERFTWQMAKIFLIIFNILVGLLVYHILLIHIQSSPRGNMIALAALNWFLLNPSTLGIVFGGYHENFMLFFVLLGIFMFKNAHYGRTGLCFGLALLVKPIVGIYMIPLLVWGIQTRDLKSIIIWIGAGFTFLIGSLPFLLLSPEEYINDVFLIHTQRPDPSMSFYTYFLSEISSTLFPFVLQLIIFGLYIVIFIKKIPVTSSKEVIVAILPFMTIFMALNRILYPHYVPFFFPFFTFTVFFLVKEYYNHNTANKPIVIFIVLILGLFLVYLGSISWSLLWSIERYETYLSNPLFPISAVICIIGLIIISVTSLFSLNYMSKEKVK
ncbi:MAG: glycosyltransferase 87 family protein [Promethearchaeota archaeon]